MLNHGLRESMRLKPTVKMVQQLNVANVRLVLERIEHPPCGQTEEKYAGEYINDIEPVRVSQFAACMESWPAWLFTLLPDVFLST